MNSYSELPEEQQELFRIGVKSMLHGGAMVVNFVKSDGTVRQLVGTLVDDMIPEAKRPKIDPEKPSKAPSTSACSVFDIEKQEWRSFKYDAIIDITPKV